MYKNKDGEDIDLKTYATQKYKELFDKDGATVFKAIQDDKNLTADERQNACLAIGKAATQYECQQAKGHTETLMRGNTGQVQFISAYIKTHAKDYITAVGDKGKLAIQNPELDQEGMSQEILKSYSTELPKLSTEAAEFMKVTSGVVKTEFPSEADALTARILVNNVSLRGGGTQIAVWLKATDPTNKQAIKVRGDVEENNRKARAPLQEVGTRVATLEGQIEKLEKELLVTKGDLETRVVQQKLEQAKGDLVVAKEKYKAEFELHKDSIEKVAKEGELALAPHKARLEMIDRGTQANNAVQTAVNGTDGFTLGTGDGDLDLDNYKTSLMQMATGTVPDRDIPYEIDVPDVDIAGVQKQVDQEKLIKDQAAKLKNDEAQQKLRDGVKNTFEESQKAAGPELKKIAALEKKLDQINRAQELKRNPGAPPKLDAEGKPIKPYKPSIAETFKSYLAKGGMDEVLKNKKEQTIDQVDKLKMQVQVKTDPDFFKEVQKSNEIGDRLLKEEMAPLQRQSEFYLAAQQQVMDADYQLTVDERLKGSDLPGMTSERRLEVEKLKVEGEKAMQKYEKGFLDHQQLEQELGMAEKNTNVRSVLMKEKVEQDKALKQSEGTGKKVGDVVQKTEKVEAPKQGLGVG